MYTSNHNILLEKRETTVSHVIVALLYHKIQEFYPFM